MVSSNCSICPVKGLQQTGVKVCDEYWADFQSSWWWGPTESRKRAGTRNMTTSCFLSWTTRSPATSCTALTPRMHRATSGSSYRGLLTSLRYVFVLKLHTHTHTSVVRWKATHILICKDLKKYLLILCLHVLVVWRLFRLTPSLQGYIYMYMFGNNNWNYIDMHNSFLRKNESNRWKRVKNEGVRNSVVWIDVKLAL